MFSAIGLFEIAKKERSESLEGVILKSRLKLMLYAVQGLQGLPF